MHGLGYEEMKERCQTRLLSPPGILGFAGEMAKGGAPSPVRFLPGVLAWQFEKAMELKPHSKAQWLSALG